MTDDVDTSWVRSIADLQSKLDRSNDYRTAKDDRGELIRPWANPADPRFDNANKLLANITASFPDSTLEERLSLVDNGMRVGEVIKGDDGKPKLTTVILTAEQKRIANALYNGDPQAEQRYAKSLGKQVEARFTTLSRQGDQAVHAAKHLYGDKLHLVHKVGQSKQQRLEAEGAYLSTRMRIAEEKLNRPRDANGKFTVAGIPFFEMRAIKRGGDSE